eukprot:15172564-Heterocapsa_arctica.AAC.1
MYPESVHRGCDCAGDGADAGRVQGGLANPGCEALWIATAPGKAHPIQFPAKLGAGKPLAHFISRRSGVDWQAFPAKSIVAGKVKAEYEKLALKGINPFCVPVCVDTACSSTWVCGALGHVMTLTKSHCETFSHWVSTKGGFLDIDDYTRLQGMDPNSIDWQGAGVPLR